MSKKLIYMCAIVATTSFSVYSMELSDVSKKQEIQKKAIRTVDDIEEHLSVRTLQLKKEQSVSFAMPNFAKRRKIDISEGENSDVTIDIMDLSSQADKDAKIYSEQEIMTFIKLSPALYELGQRKKLSAQELLMYAQLLLEFKIMKPRAMVGYIKKYSNLSDKTVKDWEVGYYADLQKKKNEEYITGMLGVIEAICDRQGEIQVSVLNDTHVEVLETHISRQNCLLKSGAIALVIKVLLFMGSVAWGIYGQVPKSTGHNATVF